MSYPTDSTTEPTQANHGDDGTHETEDGSAMLPPATKKRKVDEADDLDSLAWFYIDAHGQKQGPHSTKQMREWWSYGFFPPILPVQKESETKLTPIQSRNEIVGQAPGAAASSANHVSAESREEEVSSEEEDERDSDDDDGGANPGGSTSASAAYTAALPVSHAPVTSAHAINVAPTATGIATATATQANVVPMTPEEEANYYAYFQYGQYCRYPVASQYPSYHATAAISSPELTADELKQVAAFNARTGRFATADSTTAEQDHWAAKGLAPDRAGRQMSIFFDSEGYQEQMRRRKDEEESRNRPQKLTKQMIEQFKKKKEEKKRRKLLQGM